MMKVKYQDNDGPVVDRNIYRRRNGSRDISSGDLHFFESLDAKIIIKRINGQNFLEALVTDKRSGEKKHFVVTGSSRGDFSELREQIEEWLDPTAPAINGHTIITLTADMINALHEADLLCGDYDVTITESHGKLYAYRTEWPEDGPTYLGEV